MSSGPPGQFLRGPPELEPVGFAEGWSRVASERLSDGLARVGRGFVFDADAVVRATTCPGWWLSTWELGFTPRSVFEIRRDLCRRVLRRWVAARMLGPEPQPLLFVARVLAGAAKGLDDVGSWVKGLEPVELAELRAELAMTVARFDCDAVDLLAMDGLVVGSIGNRATRASVKLESLDVDVCVGVDTLSDGVWQPGRVLVRFTMGGAPGLLKQLGFAALLTGLRTGCPPRRVVVWNVLSGSGRGRDVDPAFLEGWLDRTIEAARAARGAIAEAGEVLTPGEHCLQCPQVESCPVADRTEYAF